MSWKGESYRHAMSSRGIASKFPVQFSQRKPSRDYPHTLVDTESGDVIRMTSHEWEEWKDRLGAKRMHLYPIKNMFRPRGGKGKKESLSHRNYEHIADTIMYWSDPKYADSVDLQTAIKIARKNYQDESNLAWDMAMQEIERRMATEL